MDIMAKTKEVIDLLDQIEEYGHSLMPKLSELDSKEQDILHYIEANKINMLTCYNIVKKIKDIRVERRKVKNDRELMDKWHDMKTKLISNSNNRQFVFPAKLIRNLTEVIITLQTIVKLQSSFHTN